MFGLDWSRSERVQQANGFERTLAHRKLLILSTDVWWKNMSWCESESVKGSDTNSDRGQISPRKNKGENVRQADTCTYSAFSPSFSLYYLFIWAPPPPPPLDLRRSFSDGHPGQTLAVGFFSPFFSYFPYKNNWNRMNLVARCRLLTPMKR